MRRTSQCVFPYTASWTKIRFAGISSLWSILWPISVEKKINLELLHLNSSFFILLLIFMCFFFFFLLFFSENTIAVPLFFPLIKAYFAFIKFQLSSSNCSCTKGVLLCVVWGSRFSLLLFSQSLHWRRKVPILLLGFVYLYLFLPTLFATKRRVPSAIIIDTHIRNQKENTIRRSNRTHNWKVKIKAKPIQFSKVN